MRQPPEVAWRPGPEYVEGSNVARLMDRHGIDAFDDLRQRSIAEPGWFWDAVVADLGIPFPTPYDAVLDTSRGIPWAEWFAGGRLNVADACVYRWVREGEGDREAVRWVGEDGAHRSLSYANLARETSRLANALHGLGVGAGDAVGVYLPMVPEAVTAMYAAASLGALYVPIFSGFAAPAVAVRLRDAGAKVLVTADGTWRRGRQVGMKTVADQALMTCPSVERVVVVRGTQEGVVRRTQEGVVRRTQEGVVRGTQEGVVRRTQEVVVRRTQEGVVRGTQEVDVPFDEARDVWLDDLTAVAADHRDPRLMDSEHPFLLAYTSGTTGTPKGAVHVHGGFTVKVAAEVAYQVDLRRDDVLWWPTDMGWIMGPWEVVGGHANGGTVLLFEGAPNHPKPDRLWEVCAEEGVTVLGTSPTLVRALQAEGDEWPARHDLSRLRVFASSGEPWNPAPWWWLFETVGESRRPIINLSGGTEVGACFLSPHTVEPIKPTSLGGPALGMAVDVVDAEGNPVRGEVGELVCRAPWPGMTRGLWKDPERYLQTYWSRYQGMWWHGDFASVDDDGFFYLHGRSDDTINVAGKRVGPAEVESVLVAHPAVREAAAVGVPDDVKGEALVCVVMLRPDAEASETLRDDLAAAVVDALGRPFAPREIRFAADLPRTRSAKILRRAIRAVLVGEEPGDLATMENPAALDAVRRAG